MSNTGPKRRAGHEKLMLSCETQPAEHTMELPRHCRWGRAAQRLGDTLGSTQVAPPTAWDGQYPQMGLVSRQNILGEIDRWKTCIEFGCGARARSRIQVMFDRRGHSRDDRWNTLLEHRK